MARKRKSKGSDNTLLYIGIAVVGFLFLSGRNANAENPGEYPEYEGYIPNPNGTTTKPGKVREVDPLTMQFEGIPDLQYASSGPSRGNLSGISFNKDYCLY